MIGISIPGALLQVALPNAAQPAGLAHNTRAPSALHTHTGAASVACAASRGSSRLHLASGVSMKVPQSSLAERAMNEFLIMRPRRRVHAAGSFAGPDCGLTLTAKIAAGPPPAALLPGQDPLPPPPVTVLRLIAGFE